MLEDANIKLASVASDVLGVSGRHILKAMLRGRRDPQKLADLALGRLREKRGALELDLQGHFTDHHRFQLRRLMDLLEFTEAQIIKTEGEILRRVAKAPAAGSDQKLQNAVDLWKTIPGVDETTACVLAAEIGTRMEQFPSAAHLASWAGLCPGNNESAGKRRSGNTRKGSVWLRCALCQAAWAASHTKSTYLSALYRRLIARKGKEKTIVAVAHTILVIAYHLLKDGRPYQDLGADYFDRLDQKALAGNDIADGARSTRARGRMRFTRIWGRISFTVLPAGQAATRWTWRRRWSSAPRGRRRYVCSGGMRRVAGRRRRGWEKANWLRKKERGMRAFLFLSVA